MQVLFFGNLIAEVLSQPRRQEPPGCKSVVHLSFSSKFLSFSKCVVYPLTHTSIKRSANERRRVKSVVTDTASSFSQIPSLSYTSRVSGCVSIYCTTWMVRLLIPGRGRFGI